MEGYDKANGDGRGILERFLPTVFRKTTDGSQTHNAILGALKKSIETTRDDLATMSFEVYFTRATGKFLDLYGKYIGLTRLPLEDDNSYRGRLLEYIKTQRGTISSIIKGIQSELGKDTNVTVYETWRNIFILNQSDLNGLDYIMGNKYRYGVIEITLDTYVDNLVLQEVVNRYKAYGIGVYYKYSLGGTTNFWDMLVDDSGRYMLDGDTIQGSAPSVYFENKKTYLADSPITTADIALFKNNVSDLNGSDVVSGNPSNAYIYDKTKSPYYHLIGYVPNSTSVNSYTDIYDYVYKNNMVIPGGRNYVLGSGTAHTGAGNNTVNQISTLFNFPLASGLTTGSMFTQWGANAPLTLSFDWSISGATISGLFFPQFAGAPYGFSAPNIVVSPTNTSGHFTYTWKVLSSYSGTSAKSIGMRLDYLQGMLSITNLKFETGAVATPWTPAPEDNDHSMDIYRFDTLPYLTLSKEDNNDYTFTPDTGSSTVFSFNVSRILANNGYNDQVKNFSSNQVGSVSIHTKGSEVGLPNTTISAVGNTGTPIAGSFQDTNPNKLFNTEFTPLGDGSFPGWKTVRDPFVVSGSYNGSTQILNTSTTSGNRLYADLVYVKGTPAVSFSVVNDSWIILRGYDQNKVFLRELYSQSRTGYGLNKLENKSIPSDIYYVEFGFQSGAGAYVSQPMLTFSSTVGDYTSGYYNQADKDNKLQYALSNDSSGDYTYNLSAPSQVSQVTLDDYYSYGRAKRVITANGAGTEVSLGIFDTNTTPTITLPTDYKVLNKDTITRYVDGILVNTDVPLSALRIYNYTTSNWDNIPTGEFKVDNYIKDAISIPGSYLLIKSVSANTFKYLDIDVTLLNLGVTK